MRDTARPGVAISTSSSRPSAHRRSLRHYVTWSATSARRRGDAHGGATVDRRTRLHLFPQSPSCQAKSPFRCIFSIAVRRFADLVVLDISANAFLQHMVRNIAGALLQVGRGEREPVDGWGSADGAEQGPRRCHRAADGALSRRRPIRRRFELPRAQPPLILRALGDVW